jgi:hypothetical protein
MGMGSKKLRLGAVSAEPKSVTASKGLGGNNRYVPSRSPRRKPQPKRTTPARGHLDGVRAVTAVGASPERHAYARGARAYRRGMPPSANPYDQFRLGAAFALGWHEAEGRPPVAIIAQAHRAGILLTLEPREPAA